MMKFMCYKTPQFSGVLTQDEREVLQEVLGAPMAGLQRAYDTMRGIWEDYFTEGKEISRLEVGCISDSFRLSLDAVWDAMLEYAMATVDTDFPGYLPYMQRWMPSSAYHAEISPSLPLKP